MTGGELLEDRLRSEALLALTLVADRAARDGWRQALIPASIRFTTSAGTTFTVALAANPGTAHGG